MVRRVVCGWLLAVVLGCAWACAKSEPVNKTETLPTHRLPGKRLPP